MYCKHCGKKIDDDSAFCNGCGAMVGTVNSLQETNNSGTEEEDAEYEPDLVERNKWYTFCLALFLGVIGVHKLYEHKYGMFLLYLLTGGLFGIGVFIDCVVALFRPDRYYYVNR